jgi:hypothetical protein
MTTKHPIIAHPLCVAAIVTLVVNDHYLKAAYGNWFTGKLSDVAGLMFFPALLAVVGKSTPRAVAIAALATAVVFALVKTWVPATDAFRWTLGFLQSPRHPRPVEAVTDPTDLVAVPAVATSWLLARLSSARPSRASPARWRGFARSSRA